MKKIRKIIAKIPFIVNVYYSLNKYKQYPSIIKDYFAFKQLSKKQKRSFKVKWADRFFSFTDNTKTTSFEPHYTYHPAWAARIVKKINPKKHIDISSALQFTAILSAFIPTEFYDYRPTDLKLSNLKADEANLLSLPFDDNSIESLSCMHTIEHIGLGRYGDTLAPNDDLKAIKELKRVTAKDGSLIIVVPIGKPKIAFNAHRIYSYEQIIKYFSDMELKEFSLIPDNFLETGLIRNADQKLVKNQDWGCGCFWFIKK